MQPKYCNICFNIKSCHHHCETCIDNNICDDCFYIWTNVNQRCPFCRVPYNEANITTTISPNQLTRTLDSILFETNTPGNVIVFQNSYNKIIKAIWSHTCMTSNTPVAININANNNGRVFEYLNTSNVWSIPHIETINVAEWNRVHAYITHNDQD